MTEAIDCRARRAREGNPAGGHADGSITIERWMLDRLALKGTAAIIYAAIWQAGPGGLSASIPSIAHRAGVSPKSAKRCLAALMGARLIEDPRPAAIPCGPRTWTASIWSDPHETNIEKGLE